MKTEKIPSKYQKDIYNIYTTTNCNIVIQAGPGSGKSHTILELLKLTPKFKKVILLAFNKSIKEELEKKVPANVKVSTLHGLGLSILSKNFGKKLKVNQYKNYILGKKFLDLSRLKQKDRDPYLFLISKIIDMSRLNLASTREEIESVCDRYNITTINGELDDVMEMVEKLEEYNNSTHDEIMIDFTDMIYMTYKYIKKSDFPKYGVVFVDELQDLTPLQKCMIERIIPPINGRFIGVGDKRQSIYAFMGANTEAFESFENRPNTKVLPLSVTYRCGKEIVKEANKVFDGLEAFENNPEGIVRKGNLTEAKSGDFIICRNNLPLIEAWIDIIKSGRKAHILGKDYGNSLLVIINKLSYYPSYVEGVNQILADKEKQLTEKGYQNPKSSSNYQQLVEKLNIIEILKKQFGTFESMKSIIEGIFNDDIADIVLTTGHRSKGLEADRVFFLKRELIPSKYATTSQELFQERCLLYVITTRAKKELIYVD